MKDMQVGEHFPSVSWKYSERSYWRGQKEKGNNWELAIEIRNDISKIQGSKWKEWYILERK